MKCKVVLKTFKPKSSFKKWSVISHIENDHHFDDGFTKLGSPVFFRWFMTGILYKGL